MQIIYLTKVGLNTFRNNTKYFQNLPQKLYEYIGSFSVPKGVVSIR